MPGINGKQNDSHENLIPTELYVLTYWIRVNDVKEKFAETNDEKKKGSNEKCISRLCRVDGRRKKKTFAWVNVFFLYLVHHP